ncbi:hypothetical protein ACFX5K_01065 [Rickettsiales bacterium LUAb2]
MFKSLAALYEYINQEKIQNIDIRFLNEEYTIKCFSIAPNHLSDKLFNCKKFQFNDYILHKLNINRCFLDPFLTHKTLVFYTNLDEHLGAMYKLLNSENNNKAILDFYLNNEQEQTDIETIANNNYLTPPPLDLDRDIRCELILALKTLNIDVITHYVGKDTMQNIVYIKANNNLMLLDQIEKFKYALLMVTNAYNKVIDLNKGVFANPCLLSQYKS